MFLSTENKSQSIKNMIVENLIAKWDSTSSQRAVVIFFNIREQSHENSVQPGMTSLTC